jgi:hypothetical protein
MAGTLKAVWFFSGPEGGWTETNYWNGNDPVSFVLPTTLGFPANAPALNYLLTRITLLHANYYLAGLRASVLGDKRNSFETDIPAGIGRGLWKYGGAAEVWTSLLVKFSHTGPPTRSYRMYLGGIPEQIVSPAELFNPTDQWNKPFGAWSSAIKDGGMQLALRPTNAQAAIAPMTAFNVSGDGLTVTISPVPAGFPAPGPAPVIVRGLKIPHGWNGVHTGNVVGGNLIIGPVKRPGVSVPAWTAANAGTIQWFNQQSLGIDLVLGMRLVKHPRGRFFEQLRGRRLRA